MVLGSQKTFEEILCRSMDVIRLAALGIRKPWQWNSTVSNVRKLLNELLDEDAHKTCSSRFGLTFTNVKTLEWIFISEYKSRNDLIDAVVCATFIPIWSGSLIFPRFRGQPYVDGAFVNNWPIFQRTPQDSERVMVCVSPFSSNADVTPISEHSDFKLTIDRMSYHYSLDSIFRFFQSIIPFRMSIYRNYLIQGHQLMKEFVLNNNMIRCEKCFLMKKDISLRDARRKNESDRNEKEDIINDCVAVETSCLYCLKLMEKVDSLEVSEKVLSAMYDGYRIPN